MSPNTHCIYEIFAIRMHLNLKLPQRNFSGIFLQLISLPNIHISELKNYEDIFCTIYFYMIGQSVTQCESSFYYHANKHGVKYH